MALKNKNGNFLKQRWLWFDVVDGCDFCVWRLWNSRLIPWLWIKSRPLSLLEEPAALCFTSPPTVHGNLCPPLAVPGSCDISTVAMKRNKRCLWFDRKWSCSQVPKRFGIFLFLVLSKKSQIVPCALKKKKKILESIPTPSLQQSCAAEDNWEASPLPSGRWVWRETVQGCLEAICKPTHVPASGPFPVPESQAGGPVTTINPCVEVFYLFFSL